jgi:hypothetical protein
LTGLCPSVQAFDHNSCVQSGAEAGPSALSHTPHAKLVYQQALEKTSSEYANLQAAVTQHEAPLFKRKRDVEFTLELEKANFDYNINTHAYKLRELLPVSSRVRALLLRALSLIMMVIVQPREMYDDERTPKVSNLLHTTA